MVIRDQHPRRKLNSAAFFGIIDQAYFLLLHQALKTRALLSTCLLARNVEIKFLDLTTGSITFTLKEKEKLFTEDMLAPKQE